MTSQRGDFLCVCGGLLAICGKFRCSMKRFVGLLGVLVACRSAPTSDAVPSSSGAPPPDDRTVAQGLLGGDALPSREEVVALADRLAVASVRAGRTPAAGDLAWLAAQLRERAFRLDKVASDGREALELYEAASMRAGGATVACDAERRRALLAGELARDASETYRELYIAHERQASLGSERTACVEQMKRMIDEVAAYRPAGQGWMDLQEQTRHEVELLLAAATAKPAEAASPVETASASSSAPAPSGGPAVPPPVAGDVVVRPDDAAIRTKSVELREIKPYSWPGGGRVVLALSGAARYDVGVLAPDAKAARGHRIFIDIAGAKPKNVRGDSEAEGLVRAVRLGSKPDGTRVVIDLASEARHRVFYLPDPFRIVVDLSTREAARAEQPKSGRKRVSRVTLDPGHGGWDSGAMGPTGLREKDVALDVAHRAAPALASELGIETMLTRDTDVYVPLEERTARANAFHSDLFVSIHCNATEDGHADGIEVYTLDPTRQMDAAAIRAVARENHNAKERARARTLDPKVLDAQVASIATRLDVADNTASSRTFAKLLQTSALASLSRYGKVNDHGVKTAAFFVLVGAEMPATLFETSFISNPTDEARLGTADYRQKLADAVVNAIRAYRDGLGGSR